MSDNMQVDIFGGETPHKEVVKNLKPPKRKAIPLVEIKIVADVIHDLDVKEEEARELAERFLNALIPMNSRLKAEEFYRWCGL